jgi:hypothetical protein
MIDTWDAMFMLAIVIVVLLMPKVSPCCGCLEADNDDCRKDCRAYQAYVRRRCGGR